MVSSTKDYIFCFSKLLLRHASQNSLDESSQKESAQSSPERPSYHNSDHFSKSFSKFNMMRKYDVLPLPMPKLHLTLAFFSKEKNFFVMLFWSQPTKKSSQHIEQFWLLAVLTFMQCLVALKKAIKTELFFKMWIPKLLDFC